MRGLGSPIRRPGAGPGQRRRATARTEARTTSPGAAGWAPRDRAERPDVVLDVLDDVEADRGVEGLELAELRGGLGDVPAHYSQVGAIGEPLGEALRGVRNDLDTDHEAGCPPSLRETRGHDPGDVPDRAAD